MDRKNIQRNESANTGRNDDPGLRDQSGIQPGANTVSENAANNDNENLTESAKDNYSTRDTSNADPVFDDEK